MSAHGMPLEEMLAPEEAPEQAQAPAQAPEDPSYAELKRALTHAAQSVTAADSAEDGKLWADAVKALGETCAALHPPERPADRLKLEADMAKVGVDREVGLAKVTQDAEEAREKVEEKAADREFEREKAEQEALDRQAELQVRREQASQTARVADKPPPTVSVPEPRRPSGMKVRRNGSEAAYELQYGGS